MGLKSPQRFPSADGNKGLPKTEREKVFLWLMCSISKGEGDRDYKVSLEGFVIIFLTLQLEALNIYWDRWL